MSTLLGLKNKSITGSREISGFQLLGTRKRFRDVYLVQASSIQENEDDVMSVAGIPSLRSLSNGAFLRSKSAKEVDSGALLWEVECSYDSHINKQKKTVEIAWEIEEIEETIDVDQITGLPIVNSVGEPFIITAPFVVPVLVIKRIQTVFSSQIILRYSNKVNSKYFWGAPPGTALMKGPVAGEIEVDGRTFWEVTYRIKFNLKISRVNNRPVLKGWTPFLLNQGTKYLKKAGDDIEDAIPFRTDGDNSTGNLNLNGTRRKGNEKGIYIPFNRFRTANFNNLNLGPFA